MDRREFIKALAAVGATAIAASVASVPFSPENDILVMANGLPGGMLTLEQLQRTYNDLMSARHDETLFILDRNSFHKLMAELGPSVNVPPESNGGFAWLQYKGETVICSDHVEKWSMLKIDRKNLCLRSSEPEWPARLTGNRG